MPIIIIINVTNDYDVAVDTDADFAVFVDNDWGVNIDYYFLMIFVVFIVLYWDYASILRISLVQSRILLIISISS